MKGEYNYVNVFLIAISIAYAVVLAIKFYSYFIRKNVSGGVVRTIKTSRRRKTIEILLWSGILFMAGAIVWIVLAPGISRTGIIFSAIFLAELMLLAVLENSSQKICVNGIITSASVLPQKRSVLWSEIKSLSESGRGEVILLEDSGKASMKVKIYCRSEDKKGLENYIRKRIAEVKLEN